MIFGAIIFALAASPALAQTTGVSTNLPVPRFVSLKADKVNLRAGPTRDNAVNWVFTRAGLPVEITAESENCERFAIRKAPKAGCFTPCSPAAVPRWSRPGRERKIRNFRCTRAGGSSVTAKLQAGVLASVKSCDKKWCWIFGDGFNGYIEQERLWGVYPNETVE